MILGRLATKLSLGALLLAALFLSLRFFSHTEQDKLLFRSLNEEKPQLQNQPRTTLAEQKRSGVIKEIFYKQGGDLLELKVNADHSRLHIDQLGSDTEILEELSGVRGVMQEKFLYRLPDGREAFLQENGGLLLRKGDPIKTQDWVDFPLASTEPMQTVHYFETDKAVYHYKNNHFVAEEVNVSTHLLQGHALVEDFRNLPATMTGFANCIEISLAGKTPLFKATQLKAEIQEDLAKLHKNPLHFEADEAVYDGITAILSGNIVIAHTLGLLSASQALLSGSSNSRTLNQIDLYDRVALNLREGGLLNCGEAHFNLEKKGVEFFGSGLEPFVVYTEAQNEKPLIVKSRAMTLELKSDSKSGLSKNQIRSITARENVTVDYNHDFIAAADRATFHRAVEEAANGLAGVICLEAEGENGHCHVTNRNGDLVHAQQIFLDSLHRRLSFAHPRGALLIHRSETPLRRIDFSADAMTWEEEQGKLTLQSHVLIAEKGLGELATEERVTVLEELQQGKRQLAKIICHGPTQLKRGEGGDQLLLAKGGMVVDHQNLRITMESPSPEEQIFYEDLHGTLHADQAEIQYEWVEGAMQPKKIHLRGHVKMVNRSALNKQEQYVLADAVEVFLATQEALLSSQEGGRVLVYDQVNQLQMSGESIRLKRDAVTKKESVQGIGAVRFHLMSDELEKMSKRFEQLKSKS